MSANSNAREHAKNFEWFTVDAGMSQLEADLQNLYEVRRAVTELLHEKWAEITEELSERQS